jgi:ankyrin repeat protein
MFEGLKLMRVSALPSFLSRHSHSYSYIINFKYLFGKFLGEKRLKYLQIYLPLYRAGLEGDWQATKAILERHPDAVRLPISEDKQTILHIATLAKNYSFVTETLKRMRPDDLELEDTDHNTALYYAALSGSVDIAKEMVNMNQKLPLIGRPSGTVKLLPLHAASMLPNKKMVEYLFSATPFEQLTATERINLLISTIHADFYGNVYILCDSFRSFLL